MTAAKALMAGVAAAVTALIAIVGPGQGFEEVGLVGWLTVILGVLGSSGVTWYVINGAGARYAKALVGGLAAGATGLIAALGDQVVTDNELLVVGLAVLVGAGLVSQTPNAPPSPVG